MIFIILHYEIYVFIVYNLCLKNTEIYNFTHHDTFLVKMMTLF